MKYFRFTGKQRGIVILVYVRTCLWLLLVGRWRWLEEFNRLRGFSRWRWECEDDDDPLFITSVSVIPTSLSLGLYIGLLKRFLVNRKVPMAMTEMLADSEFWVYLRTRRVKDKPESIFYNIPMNLTVFHDCGAGHNLVLKVPYSLGC